MTRALLTIADVDAAAIPGVDPARVEIALRSGGEDALLAFGYEPFDSEIFDMKIGRILTASAATTGAHVALLEELKIRAKERGYDQILRRIPATNLHEVWALEQAGFALMDIGVTFGRTFEHAVEAPGYTDLVVRPSTDADLEHIVVAMLELPWGSRYEADPEYPEAKVRELRTRWLWKSHQGRAAIVLVGEVDGQTAGYVTCMLDAATRHGEVELVGTLPGFRGRRVASRILEHAIAWFSTRARHVTVRTQATNYAAASLYAKAGFNLEHADLTFRFSQTETDRRQTL